MKTSTGHIHVISCGIDTRLLDRDTAALIAGADTVAGGKRLLQTFAPEHPDTVVIAADPESLLKQLIAAASSGAKTAVLASGDALFHGIGGTLSRLAPPELYTIHPNISAFQYLCAKCGVAWEHLSLFSIHGKNSPVPWRDILAARGAIVYCDPALSASGLAALLVEKFPPAADTPAIIGEQLGIPDSELIRRGSLRELSACQSPGLSMLLIPAASELRHPPLPLGLDDSEYLHENKLITHPEVRAVILAKLRLRPGVMWDLGAGSGAVGIEAAGLCPGLNVEAVEKNPERHAMIEANASAHGIGSLRAHHMDILDAIDTLPDPDMVFIGGGGKDVSDILVRSFQKLKPGGRIAITAVTMETAAVLTGTLPGNRLECLSLAISRAQPLGPYHLMKPDNPINIFIYGKN